MRTSYQPSGAGARLSESGLKKEVREMLPVIIFKESFLVRDTQCSVCLGDYQANDRLQQIPACGHTFHMECIDHWLATNTTCPLCRLSLLPSPQTSAIPVHSPESIHSQGDSHLSLDMNIDHSARVRESSDRLPEGDEEDVAQHRHLEGRVLDGETCTSSNCQVEDFQVGTKDAEVEESGSGVEMHCHCALERI
ncbi:hypothetical protein H6P81_001585 [Aristolochia fimbriata]|uniref:RING-type E3 ubiquitin transferase n=1 Tax=Aristolochia fimbriata TaxID=158543 RepID=A0AAV7FAK2_ARIFI|nr:hypothetical protein H6P81_001585 [Aristolochia fimbriata]